MIPVLFWFFAGDAAPHITPYDPEILYAIAFVTAVIGFWKLIWPALKRAKAEFAEIWGNLIGAGLKIDELDAKLNAKLDDNHAAIEEVRKEVKPNSGSSLRDAVNRIERNVTLIGARQDAQVDLSDDIWWEANPAGMVTIVNKKFCDLVGRDEREILGANWKNTIHPEDREKLASDWMQAVKDCRDTEFDYRVMRPDGTVIPVRAKSTVKRDPMGLLLGWFGTVRVQVEGARPVRARETRVALPRILIVDDDVEVTSILKIALSPFYAVSVANSGGAALQHYNSVCALGDDLDLMLLDFTMPEMDGLEVARRIRESEGEGINMGLIFFTGAGQFIPQAQRELYRIEAVLDKPTDPMLIKARIDRFLERRR